MAVLILPIERDGPGNNLEQNSLRDCMEYLYTLFETY